MEKQSCHKPEIWGGIECTINRVKDQFYDQLHYSGHYHRSSDIMDIAKLGIKKLRYPLLWEKHQPLKQQSCDFSFSADRINSIRNSGVEIIAGLLHHGSGPAYTNLSDPEFPELFASYASEVAKQFPWIVYYTPVNEPLTTARFSGLYGIWYPHQSSSASFLQILFNQLKATVLAMKEIRKINPSAQLVQTEDLAKIYSTTLLKYQADFENERRWLTYDILCGKLDNHHPLYTFCKTFGVKDEQLNYFLDHPCPPDIFGFNHYLTSERYLDEKLYLYPEVTHGGNGKHCYADVEAVRVEIQEETGIKVLLEEAWERFHQPMAITEVHLHCHREDQLKWFRHVYETAKELNAVGIPIKAITSWAMLGSYGWNKLLTQAEGDYEPGAFDISSGKPRPTALAHFIRDTISTQICYHPFSQGDGWWQRNSRIQYGPMIQQVRMKNESDQPILIIGKNGTLGKAFARICESRCLPYQLISRKDCDISNRKQIRDLLQLLQPWAVINAAGYVRVDDAENESHFCYRDNTIGAKNLALETKVKEIKLASFSSDLVFDGKKIQPYVESDQVNPLNIYGRSKADAEKFILSENPSTLLIRTSAFFSSWDEYNFIHYVKHSLVNGNSIQVASDINISPTYVPDLVNATLDLLIDDETGIWHLANQGEITWYRLALMAADKFQLNKNLIQPLTAASMNFSAPRPLYSVLGTERGNQLPSLENAFERYMSEYRIDTGKIAMTA